MTVRSSGLALLAVASVTAMVTACSSTSSTGAGGATASASGTATGGAATGGASASASATASTGAAGAGAAIPAGFKREGGTEQGISLAVASSWVSVNLAKESLASAAQKLDVPGINAAELESVMQTLQKDHAIFAYDVASANSNANHYVRNLNAYCAPSGITDTGSDGIPFLQQAVKSQLSTLATNITQQDVMIGGVPGLKTSYKLKTGSGIDSEGQQLEVLPKPNVGCFVTLSFSTPETAGNYLDVAAATAQFP